MTWALAKLCKLFAILMNLRNSLKILKGISSNHRHGQPVVPPSHDSTSTSLPSSLSTSSSTTSISHSPPSLSSQSSTSTSLPYSTSTSSSTSNTSTTTSHPSLSSSSSTSSISSSSSSSSLSLTSTGTGVLMFWSIFGMIILWEQYFEIFIRWIPLYYYVKSFFILLMAFPRLKFTHNIFNQYLIPTFEWTHIHYEHLNEQFTEFDWKSFFILLPVNILLLFFPFHIEVKYPIKDSKGQKEKEIEREGTEEIQIENEFDLDLSIPLYDDEEEQEGDTVESKLDDTGFPISNSPPRVGSDQSSEIPQTPPPRKTTPSNHTGEPVRVTLRKKYEYSSDPLADLRDSPRDSTTHQTTPPPSKKTPTEEVNEVISPLILNGFRQLLTGDSNAKLRDSIFNFDMHSPNPNTLYRQRHSMIPSDDSESSPLSQKSNETTKRPSRRPPAVSSRELYSQITSPSSSSSTSSASLNSTPLHRILQGKKPSSASVSSSPSASSSTSYQTQTLPIPVTPSSTSSTSTRLRTRARERGVRTRTKMMIDEDDISDDITSPLHLSLSHSIHSTTNTTEQKRENKRERKTEKEGGYSDERIDRLERVDRMDESDSKSSLSRTKQETGKKRSMKSSSANGSDAPLPFDGFKSEEKTSNLSSSPYNLRSSTRPLSTSALSLSTTATASTLTDEMRKKKKTEKEVQNESIPPSSTTTSSSSSRRPISMRNTTLSTMTMMNNLKK